MPVESNSTFRVQEYKGCDIRVASYKSAAHGWIPEACFCIHTEKGLRRVWIASFAHCLGIQEFRFRSKLEADNYAFSMARTLIDKTSPEFERTSEPSPSSRSNYLAKIVRFARRSRFKGFRYGD
jgi:hypothetical protein